MYMYMYMGLREKGWDERMREGEGGRAGERKRRIK